MIKINITYAITVYLSLTIIVLISLWIFYNFKKQEPIDTSKYLYQCPYCTYIFYIYTKQKSLLCPRCKSVIIEQDINF